MHMCSAVAAAGMAWGCDLSYDYVKINAGKRAAFSAFASVALYASPAHHAFAKRIPGSSSV